MLHLFIHVLFLSFATAQGPLELTADRFDVQVKQKENTLVMFYAPWCGHCKRVKPDFEAAAKQLHESKTNVQLARVDCTTQDKICTKYGVTGYPTIKFFKDGELSGDYTGSRDKDGFVRFVTQRSQPASQLLSSAVELEDLLNSEAARTQPVVITYFTSEADEWLKTYMSIAAKHMDDAIFGHVFDASLADLTITSRLRLYRPKSLHIKLEESAVTYDGALSDAVSQWIIEQSFGLVGYRSATNRKFFPMDNLLVFYNNVSVTQYPKGVNYYRNRLIKLLRTIDNSSPKLTFAYSFSGDFHHEISEFGHEEDGGMPFVGIFSGGKKYKLAKYEPEAFIEFLKKFKAGTLEPYMKSEPIPTDQTEVPMKVVALNFDEVVNDPKKDVFIMFHAPWCGHCKQLKPKFESLAKKLQNEPSVSLVTFDATANDVPNLFTVHGYPTLYFVPKNAKNNPKPYDGAREEDDLFKYLAKESTDGLVGFDRNGEAKKVEL